MLEEFSWGNYSPGVSFLMMPMYADVLRLQGIEFNDMIRKSGYGFQLINKRIRIFPDPQEDMTIHFDYILTRSKRKSITK